jgi:hypothetical protein
VETLVKIRKTDEIMKDKESEEKGNRKNSERAKLTP